MDAVSSGVAILSDQVVSDLTLPVALKPDVLEHIRRLQAEYTYSIRFVLTYHLALIGILAGFSIWHCYVARSLRCRRPCHLYHDAKEKDQTKALWITSIFRRAIVPTRDTSTETGENTPLITPAENKARTGGIRAICRSILMYQPNPLPIFNRTMPSNATSLLVISLLGLNVFYLFFRISLSSIEGPSILGNRSAVLFVANLPWLYFLAAKHQPIQILTGYSYENLNILHRRLGEWLTLLAILHAFGMVMSWYNFLREAGLSFAHFLTVTYILFGVLAFVCYNVLYLTSLSSFRAWWYEMFLGCHIVLQLAALVLLFLHHHRGRYPVGAALIIILVDRLVLRSGLKTRTAQADLTILDDGQTVLVSASWPVVPRSSQQVWGSWTSRSVLRGWRPSEHVFLTIPALASKHVFQAHPFTIASAAPGDDAVHAWLNLVIRAQAGFSQDLLQYARSHASVTVRLDGPYGSSHALDMLQSSDLCVAVVGGSGIAVAYPLLWELLRTAGQDGEAAIVKGRFHLIWIVQDASHLSWIGHERLDELREMGLHIVLPPPTRKCGRPDVPVLLRELVEQESKSKGDVFSVGVLVSGPDRLNRSVRNACAEMVGEGWAIDVAVEKYGW